MSGKNNVNPGQYKVAGRERTDDLAKERMKEAKPASARNEEKSKAAKRPSPRPK